MHSDSNGSLCSASDIVPVPCNTHGNIRVDSVEFRDQPSIDDGAADNHLPTDSQKGADILNGGRVRRDQHNKPEDCDETEEHHVDASLLRPISCPTPRNRCDTPHNIRWNTHQLGRLVGIAHVSHNGRQEQGNRVEWSVDT